MVDVRQTAGEVYSEMQGVLTHQMGPILNDVVKLAAMGCQDYKFSMHSLLLYNN